MADQTKEEGELSDDDDVILVGTSNFPLPVSESAVTTNPKLQTSQPAPSKPTGTGVGGGVNTKSAPEKSNEKLGSGVSDSHAAKRSNSSGSRRAKHKKKQTKSKESSENRQRATTRQQPKMYAQPPVPLIKLMNSNSGFPNLSNTYLPLNRPPYLSRQSVPRHILNQRPFPIVNAHPPPPPSPPPPPLPSAPPPFAPPPPPMWLPQQSSQNIRARVKKPSRPTDWDTPKDDMPVGDFEDPDYIDMLLEYKRIQKQLNKLDKEDEHEKFQAKLDTKEVQCKDLNTKTTEKSTQIESKNDKNEGASNKSESMPNHDTCQHEAAEVISKSGTLLDALSKALKEHSKSEEEGEYQEEDGELVSEPAKEEQDDLDDELLDILELKRAALKSAASRANKPAAETVKSVSAELTRERRSSNSSRTAFRYANKRPSPRNDRPAQKRRRSDERFHREEQARKEAERLLREEERQLREEQRKVREAERRLNEDRRRREEQRKHMERKERQKILLLDDPEEQYKRFLQLVGGDTSSVSKPEDLTKHLHEGKGDCGDQDKLEADGDLQDNYEEVEMEIDSDEISEKGQQGHQQGVMVNAAYQTMSATDSPPMPGTLCENWAHFAHAFNALSEQQQQLNHAIYPPLPPETFPANTVPLPDNDALWPHEVASSLGRFENQMWPHELAQIESQKGGSTNGGPDGDHSSLWSHETGVNSSIITLSPRMTDVSSVTSSPQKSLNRTMDSDSSVFTEENAGMSVCEPVAASTVEPEVHLTTHTISGPTSAEIDALVKSALVGIDNAEAHLKLQETPSQTKAKIGPSEEGDVSSSKPLPKQMSTMQKIEERRNSGEREALEEEEAMLRAKLLKSYAARKKQQENVSSAEPSPQPAMPQADKIVEKLSAKEHIPTKSLSRSKSSKSHVLPKHAPVVISLGEDSDSDPESGCASEKTTSSASTNHLLGSLDDFIKEQRLVVEKEAQKKSDYTTTTAASCSTPTHSLVSQVVNPPMVTPPAMQAMPRPTRNEYHRLKQMIKQRQESKGSMKSEKSTGEKPTITTSPTKAGSTVGDMVMKRNLVDMEQAMARQSIMLQSDRVALNCVQSEVFKKRQVLRLAEAKLIKLREQLAVTEKIVDTNRLKVEKLNTQAQDLQNTIETRTYDMMSSEKKMVEFGKKVLGIEYKPGSGMQLFIQKVQPNVKANPTFRRPLNGPSVSPISVTIQSGTSRHRQVQVQKTIAGDSRNVELKSSTLKRVASAPAMTNLQKESKISSSPSSVLRAKERTTLQDRELALIAMIEKYKNDQLTKSDENGEKVKSLSAPVKPIRKTVKTQGKVIKTRKVTAEEKRSKMIARFRQRRTSNPSNPEHIPTEETMSFSFSEDITEESDKMEKKAGRRKSLLDLESHPQPHLQGGISQVTPSSDQSAKDDVASAEMGSGDGLNAAKNAKSKSSNTLRIVLPKGKRKETLCKLYHDEVQKLHRTNTTETSLEMTTLFLPSSKKMAGVQLDSAAPSQDVHKLPKGHNKYSSVLKMFKSYRFSPYYRTKEGLGLKSLTITHKLLPNKPLCRFDLMGKCNDDKCPWQHTPHYQPSTDELFYDLAAYCPSLCGISEKTAPQHHARLIKNYMDVFHKKNTKLPTDGQLLLLNSTINDFKGNRNSALGFVNTCSREWHPVQEKNATDSSKVDGLLVKLAAGGDMSGSPGTDLMCDLGDQSLPEDIRYWLLHSGDEEKLEATILDNPLDTKLWIKLAYKKLHRRDGNDKGSGLDRALNVLARGLEANTSSSDLWRHYLSLYHRRPNCTDIRDLYKKALHYAPSYQLHWQFLSKCGTVTEVLQQCTAILKYLTQDTPGSELPAPDCEKKSHYIMEVLLYQAEYSLQAGLVDKAESILKSATETDESEVPDLWVDLVTEDRVLLYLVYVYVVVYHCMPPNLTDPTMHSPGRLINKKPFLIPWSAQTEPSIDPQTLISLLLEAIDKCSPNRGLTKQDATTSVSTPSNTEVEESTTSSVQVTLSTTSSSEVTESTTSSAEGEISQKSPSTMDLQERASEEEEAVSMEVEAVSSDVSDVCLPLHKNIVMFYLALGRTEEAVQYCRQQLKKQPKHINMWLVSAEPLSHTGAVDDALQLLLASVVHNPLSSLLYLKAADLYMLLGDSDSALEHLENCAISMFDVDFDDSSTCDPNILYCRLLGLPYNLTVRKMPRKAALTTELLQEQQHYLWACYCMLLDSQGMGAQVPETYEASLTSVCSIENQQYMWTRYIHWKISQLQSSRNPATDFHSLTALVYRCLRTMPTRIPVPYDSISYCRDYSFHNSVIQQYIGCLEKPEDVTSAYERFYKLYPCNVGLVERMLSHLQECGLYTLARGHCSVALLHMRNSTSLWIRLAHLADNLESPSRTRASYQAALRQLPHSPQLWKHYLLFELAHGTPQTVKPVYTRCRMMDFGVETWVQVEKYKS